MLLLSALIFYVFVFFALSQPCYANALDFSPGSPHTIMFSVLFFFGLTVVIESVIVVLSSKNKIAPGNYLSSMFAPIIAINFITFPLAQAAVFGLIALFNSQWAGYAAEIIPFVAEYFLLKWVFARLHRQGFLIERFTNRRILILAIVSNLASAAAGSAFVYWWG